MLRGHKKKSIGSRLKLMKHRNRNQVIAGLMIHHESLLSKTSQSMALRPQRLKSHRKRMHQPMWRKT